MKKKDKVCKECKKTKALCNCDKFVAEEDDKIEMADKDKEKPKDKIEMSVESHKCLECGCNLPEETHGRTDVSTADIVAPNETPKSADAEEVVDTPTEEKVEDKDSADEKPADIEAIVEQVVESATKALKTEIASLVAAKKAAETKAVDLESELAIAKTLAVAGGPKRTAKPVGETSSDLFVKSATYREKAKATTDPTLAKGYKQLADEFLVKATEATSK